MADERLDAFSRHARRCAALNAPKETQPPAKAATLASPPASAQRPAPEAVEPAMRHDEAAQMSPWDWWNKCNPIPGD